MILRVRKTSGAIANVAGPRPRGEGAVAISEAAENELKQMEAKIISRYISFCYNNSYVEGQSLGEGIKRTPAYETNLTQTEVADAVKLFWGTFYCIK